MEADTILLDKKLEKITKSKNIPSLLKENKIMPLTPKGKKIMKSMKKQYGAKKGETVFYASKNKGAIKGVDKKRKK